MFSSPGYKDDPVSCHRRLDFGYLRGGCYLLGSSAYIPTNCLYSEKNFDSTEPPFDRHDWVVRRPQTGEEVRYVIDYYSAPPERDGSPVFSLDVRPALDSFSSITERIAVATEDVWASFRESRGNHSAEDSRRSS
jgi:hypothetical protein